ncbi:MAG: DUF2971 domain-containing protein [Verrucomicrobia bacterium]|nr:DUF2971 domain-containing protein [Verrucomicrobiota bacterium]
MPKQIFQDSERRLHDNEQIWRYVPLRTLFYYLDGLVFIPSISKLRAGDPFEGKFYLHVAWFNTAFAKRYGDDAKKIEEWILDSHCPKAERDTLVGFPGGASGFQLKYYMEFLWKTRFAWCWFRSLRESAAMWSVYGNQGVAIETTVGRVAAVLDADFEVSGRKFIYGPMTYVDHRTGRSAEFNPELESDFHLLLRPFFLKREEYKSENEIRFIKTAAERSERGGILLKNVKPKDWIQAIRLWPGLTTAEAQSLCKTIKLLLPHVDCRRSDLFSESPPGTSRGVENFIAGLEDATDSDYQTCQDGIPSSLKEL